jgi:hypothetical protein
MEQRQHERRRQFLQAIRKPLHSHCVRQAHKFRLTRDAEEVESLAWQNFLQKLEKMKERLPFDWAITEQAVEWAWTRFVLHNAARDAARQIAAKKSRERQADAFRDVPVPDMKESNPDSLEELRRISREGPKHMSPKLWKTTVCEELRQVATEFTEEGLANMCEIVNVPVEQVRDHARAYEANGNKLTGAQRQHVARARRILEGLGLFLLAAYIAVATLGSHEGQHRGTERPDAALTTLGAHEGQHRAVETRIARAWLGAHEG